MSKVIKEMMINQIGIRLDGCRDLVILDTSKVDAITDNNFRAELSAKGIRLMNVKNTLARLALKEIGIDSLDDALAGPSTIAWGGEDIVGLSREMASWAKKIDALQIKGGAVDGQGVDSKGVVDISKGPSRLDLIGQISGLMLSPGRKLAGAMLGPGGKLAAQLKTIVDGDNSGSTNEEGGDAA